MSSPRFQAPGLILALGIAFVGCVVFVGLKGAAVRSGPPVSIASDSLVSAPRIPEEVSPNTARSDGVEGPGVEAAWTAARARPQDAGKLVVHQKREELPGWAVGFGKEFWRRPQSISFAQRPASDEGASQLPIQVGDVIDRVSHAFAPDASSCGARVEGRGYRALLDSDGLRFAPANPAFGGGQPDPAPTGEAQSEEEIRFRTRWVQRGDRLPFLASSDPVGWHVLGNTAQALRDLRSGLVEHYEARSEGIEVTWLIPQAPEGDGDLVIGAELAGLSSSRQTSSGIHFTDAHGLARVKIGPLTAVDQQGRRWNVPARATGNEFWMTVPGPVLAQATYPLAIDPLISAEFGVDQPVEGPSPCTRAAPAVAAGEAAYLVVWTHGKGEATDPAVCGARVDAGGRLLDPYGMVISSSAGEQTVCAAAANPGGFLAVWSAPHGASTTDWDILGARIQADGTLLDAPPLPVCGLAGSLQCSPTVAANGDNYLVAWRDSRGTGIYGTLVGLDGKVASTNGAPICTAVNDQFAPAAAALGTNYLVVWQDYRRATSSQYYSDIYGARITGSGILTDTNGVAICTRTNSQFHPTAAANGTHYLVVWEDYDNGGNDIYGTRVSAEGTVLDSDGLVIGHATNAQANPVVTGSGGGFLAAWQDYRSSPPNEFTAVICGARVQGDGTVLDPAGLVLSTTAGSHGAAAVAGREDEAVVVWQDFRNNPLTSLADIYAARVSSVSNAVVQPDFAVTGSVNGEVSPALAANGTNFLVVWADNRNGLAAGLDIYGARVDPDGALLDPSTIAICTATNRQADPAVAANGTNYLVVWSDWRNTPPNATHADIYGSLVSAAGSVLQTDGLAICTVTNDQSLPAVTALGNDFLVVWQDARSNLSTTLRPDIYGARVDALGVVLDCAGIAICTNTASQITPAAAAGSAEALVVWADCRNGTTSDIYGTHVAQNGRVVEPDGIEICRAPNHQSAPAVAANGMEYLVVWADARNGAANVDIYAARVTPTGPAPPINGFPVHAAAGQQTAPAVAAQGPDYLVVWQDARASTSSSFDILGARVPADGAGSVTLPFLIDTNANNQLVPAVAAGANGPCLVVSQGAPYSVARTVAVLSNLQRLARLDSGRLGVDGRFGFRLWGAPTLRYQIEVSEDLQTWTPSDSFLMTNDWLWFTDPTGQPAPGRFYRAVLLP